VPPDGNAPGVEPEPAHEVLDILSELKKAEEDQATREAPSAKKNTSAFKRVLCCLKQGDEEEAAPPSSIRKAPAITIKQRK